jgi:hypothetical protein
MGIKQENFIMVDLAEEYFGDKWTSINMMELGCQQLRRMGRGHKAKGFKIAKKYFESIGINHVSIDLSAKYESLPINLGVPIKQYIDWSDCTTDFGTLEHVDIDGFHGQHQAWKNMHDMTKVSGLMIHVIPQDPFAYEHCPFHYRESFVEKLATACDYEVMHSSITHCKQKNGKPVQLLRFMYRRQLSKEFITFDELMDLDIITETR